MQLKITGLQLDVTDALRDYVTEKMSRLERHFDKIISANITLEVDKLQQKAEGTLHVAGTDLVAEAEHTDMYAAIDLLVDRLDRQLIKHKEKNIGRQQGVNDR